MTSPNNLLGKLARFAGTKRMLVADQDVFDIIRAMMAAQNLYAKDYDLISEQFYKGNARSSAKAVYDFLKKHIDYKIDPASSQKIMSPSAILHIAANDCKNFALFIVGVMQSLKRKGLLKNDSFFRFASYKLLDEIPHHVFAVVVDDNGEEIFVDPVLPTFNNRKHYFHKVDKKVSMPIYSISGTGSRNQVGSLKTLFLKVSMAPSRGAFLLLVGVNAFDWGHKLYDKVQLHRDKVKSWWENLGGDFNHLLAKINQSTKGRPDLKGFEDNRGQVGVLPAIAGAAALVAAAAPIAAALINLFKSMGANKAELDALRVTADATAKQAVQSAVAANPGATSGGTLVVPTPTLNAAGQLVTVPSGTDTTAAQKMSAGKIALIAGGGLALLYFIRKRK